MLDTRHVIKVLTATNRIPARLRDGLSRREKCRIFSPTDSSSSFTVSALTEKNKTWSYTKNEVYGLSQVFKGPFITTHWRIVTYTHGYPGVPQYVHRRQSIRGIHH